MGIVDIPSFGRLWHCGNCRITQRGSTIYPWREQGAQEHAVDVRETKTDRYLSKKPCPQCGKPMWALQDPGYGTRHQCEDCRLTVLFGGAIARWRTPKKT